MVLARGVDHLRSERSSSISCSSSISSCFGSSFSSSFGFDSLRRGEVVERSCRGRVRAIGVVQGLMLGLEECASPLSDLNGLSELLGVREAGSWRAEWALLSTLDAVLMLDQKCWMSQLNICSECLRSVEY